MALKSANQKIQQIKNIFQFWKTNISEKKKDVKTQLLSPMLVLEKYRGEERFLPGFGKYYLFL